MNNNQGFIKIYKKMLDWEWYKDNNTKCVFMHCLLKANWKDGRFRGYEVPRGSFVTGRRQLAKELKMSEQSIRTALEHLISTHEVTIKKTSKFSIITVVNYDYYQESNPQTNHQVTSNQPASNHNRRNKEIKNIRSVREENTLISPALTDVISYGSSLGASNEYCERFYNHYESIGWINANGLKIKNWKLVLSNWYKKDLENGKIKIDTRRRLD
ncbi:MAG: hypothetical protein SPJ27_09115 [Candidatus Onthovivens sp.]|nr:hypothetical protein [Candidatus Onthovivens sp.]